MSDDIQAHVPESLHTPDIAPEDRVPRKQKIAYGMGAVNDMWGSWMYPTVVWPVFNIFLQVNPALVSLALMINRLVDLCSDPFYGWWSDNTRTRFGRRRPFILTGSILAGICFPLLFMVDPNWSEKTIFFYMVVSSGIYITIVSMFNMPYQSLGNELTPDYNERTNLFAYKGAIQKIGEVGTFFAATFITLSFFNDPETGEPNILEGMRVYAMIIGCLMIAVGMIVSFTVKERYYSKVIELDQGRVKLLETLWGVLKCRPFRAQLSMALAYGLGTSMLGSLGYYLTIYYVCGGDVALGSKWNFAMGLSGMLCGLAGVPTFAYIAKIWGKRRAMASVQFAGIAAFIGSWWFYNPDIRWLQLFASGSIAFTQGGFWMLYGTIGADVIDYDELETGKRREGAFAACGTYLMKVGLAIGIGLSGVILASTGFDAALGADQDPGAITRIRIYFMVFPIAGLLLAYVSLMLFGLTRQRMSEIRGELEDRRGKV